VWLRLTISPTGKVLRVKTSSGLTPAQSKCVEEKSRVAKFLVQDLCSSGETEITIGGVHRGSEGGVQ
jgi:hypothetical protein